MDTNKIIIPDEDGITHINIYSKGATPLGKMLSNFYKFPILTPDGDFLSVEGYWYWLSIPENNPRREEMRAVYGFNAKKLGKEILKDTPKEEQRFDDNFEEKILLAIWRKFRRNAHLITEDLKYLPMEHYYNYGGKVVDCGDKYPWMLEGITKMRDILVQHPEKGTST
jgi:hypothetical protein